MQMTDHENNPPLKRNFFNIFQRGEGEWNPGLKKLLHILFTSKGHGNTNFTYKYFLGVEMSQIQIEGKLV